MDGACEISNSPGAAIFPKLDSACSARGRFVNQEGFALCAATANRYGRGECSGGGNPIVCPRARFALARLRARSRNLRQRAAAPSTDRSVATPGGYPPCAGQREASTSSRQPALRMPGAQVGIRPGGKSRTRRDSPIAPRGATCGTPFRYARRALSDPKPETLDLQAVAADAHFRQGREILRGKPPQP